jgi:hypothetical protein
MEKMRTAYEIFIGKMKGRDHVENLSVDGKKV